MHSSIHSGWVYQRILATERQITTLQVSFCLPKNRQSSSNNNSIFCFFTIRSVSLSLILVTYAQCVERLWWDLSLSPSPPPSLSRKFHYSPTCSCTPHFHWCSVHFPHNRGSHLLLCCIHPQQKEAHCPHAWESSFNWTRRSFRIKSYGTDCFTKASTSITENIICLKYHLPTHHITILHIPDKRPLEHCTTVLP